MTLEAHDAWGEYFNRHNEEGANRRVASRVSGDSIDQTAIT